MKNSKKIRNLTLNLAKGIINTELKNNSNSTTCGIIYQPKAPTALKKFSKVENDK